MYHFFTSIEFYVIACVVAAAIVIISAMPKQIGEARQFLLAGFLCSDTDNDDEEETLPHSAQYSNQPGDTPSGKIQSLPNNIPSNVSFSNNVGVLTPTSTPTSAPGQEPSIVEVTENGEREIPVSKGRSNGKNKGRNNKKQSQSTANIPGWITGTAEGKEPEIDLLCLEDGTVKLIRKGLNGLVTADGAVSLACTLIGFDLKIEERLTYGGRNLKDPAPTEAVFTLDFLAPNEHYHIHYNSDTIHRMTAFTLATKDGIHMVRTLS